MEAPAQALRRIFGFEHFRPGQAEAVAAALGGRDALVVMPTGSGKSVCYQLPALMRHELTLVVSPLVSLMQDQAGALSRVAPGQAAVINGQRRAAENASALERARSEQIRLLYVAPERFAARGFLDAVGQARVGLFVVDEAHCVSQWGHDFRPDYFALAEVAHTLRARATMALTATATPRVAGDIARRLLLREPVRVRTGFERPNLTFAVTRCGGTLDKRRRLAAALAASESLPAIVYAGTRSASEQLAASLSRELGMPGGVLAYHAGLDRAARTSVQERFMSGSAPVIVATNAFGMGIDKADVRTVCHAAVPASLEAYYQEAGRAGRDGAPARCILFSERRDKGLHVFFIQRSRMAEEVFERVAERLRWAGADGRYDVHADDLMGVVNDGDSLRAVIGHLVRAGFVKPLPAPADRVAGLITGDWDRAVLSSCLTAARDAERLRWRQYRAIWEYAEKDQCRRQALLRYFGDDTTPGASGDCCDVCARAIAPAGAARAP
ncbi:MAG: RecQ family ATP-dependent DNA helicase [Actinobacteria bacterium]|jgi:ATP-dependent DNA helicase RecQ|nr:MAG: RecQ family ATP-dependent DNA helicase [Actinomycetota bacterium]